MKAAMSNVVTCAQQVEANLLGHDRVVFVLGVRLYKVTHPRGNRNQLT